MPTQEETAVQPLNKDSSFDNKSSIVRRARIKTAIGDAVLGIVLFGAAGDLVWLQGWAYMAVLLASTILSLFGPFQIDAGLMQERMSKKPDAKQWDWFFVALVGILTFAELIVPAFDHRWGWTHQLRPWMSWLGLAMVALGTLILIWSMRVNRFFSAVIRIQSDRGHHVISTGPYRKVRHPGYAGWAYAPWESRCCSDPFGLLSPRACSSLPLLSGRVLRIGSSRQNCRVTRSMRQL